MRLGAIFDWDGIIIDSSRYHERSWDLLAGEEGLMLPPGHFQKGFGMKNKYIIPQILHWASDSREIDRLSLRKEILYREIVVKENLQPLPGVVEFLSVLQDLSIPCAIGSSTPFLNIQVVLEKIGISEFFSGIVSGDEVIESKPDPQVFLMAARKILCKPEHCVVFEDAPAGIAAAHNGGMKAVGVATTHPARVLKEADIVVPGFEGFTLTKLKELFHTPDGRAA